LIAHRSSDRAPEIATRTARTAPKRPRERFTARSLERYSNPERARASNALARKTRTVAIQFEGG